MTKVAVESGTWADYVAQAELAAKKAAEAALKRVKEISDDPEKQDKLLLMVVQRLLFLKAGEKDVTEVNNLDNFMHSKKITSNVATTAKIALKDAANDKRLFNLTIGLTIELIVKETNINQKAAIAKLVKPQ